MQFISHLKPIVFVLLFAFSLFSEQKNTIGSHMMSYFPLLLRHSMNGEKIPKKNILKSKSKPEILNFYKELPWQVELTDEELILLKAIPEKIWELRYHWNPGRWFGYQDPHYINYHKVVRSVSQRIIKKALRKVGYDKQVKHPVIHYRLGDVPFSNHKEHHQNYYAFYLWALEKIPFKDEGDKTVIIISANHHRATDHRKESSIKYLDDFTKFLNENGYHTIIQSESILDDFATMVFAPAVISGASSFSFMAGIASDGIFLSSRIGQETKKDFHTVDDCAWMCPFTPLLHRQAGNYHKTEAIFKKLRSFSFFEA